MQTVHKKNCHTCGTMQMIYEGGTLEVEDGCIEVNNHVRRTKYIITTNLYCTDCEEIQVFHDFV